MLFFRFSSSFFKTTKVKNIVQQVDSDLDLCPCRLTRVGGKGRAMERVASSLPITLSCNSNAITHRHQIPFCWGQSTADYST